MRPGVAAIALCASLFLGGAVLAAEAATSATPGAVSVTIYRDNLAMMREQRSLTVDADTRNVEFAGVSDGILPESASVLGLQGTERERNFDYNLLTPAALMRNAVGRELRLTRTLPGSGKVTETVATVISASDGLVLSIDGKHEAFTCSGLPERLSFDVTAQNLRSSPTLSTRFAPGEAGPRDLSVHYLTSSLSWTASYVATLAADGRSLDLRGAITLTNAGSVALRDAEVFAVAGELNRAGGNGYYNGYYRGYGSWFANCWPSGQFSQGMDSYAAPIPGAAAAPAPAPAMMKAVAEADMLTATSEKIADYQLYKLPVRTTVEAYQSKQVAFLRKPDVTFDRVYRFRFHEIELSPAMENYPQPVLKLVNSVKTGLGEPLAAGAVHLVLAGPDGAFPLGEAALKDIPVGEAFELPLPPTTNIRSVSFLKDQRVRDKAVERTIQHIVHNSQSTVVTVEIEHILPRQDVTFGGSTIRPVKSGEDWRRWSLKVPARGQATLTYKLRMPLDPVIP